MSKFGCCPAKPLLLTLAILFCLDSFIRFFTITGYLTLLPLAQCLMDGFLILSLVKMKSKTLLISKYLMAAQIVFVLVPWMILPLFYATMTSSGLLDETIAELNVTDDSGQKWGKTTSELDKFSFGFSIGLLLEIGLLMVVGVRGVMYILTDKIWREEMEKKEFIQKMDIIAVY